MYLSRTRIKMTKDFSNDKKLLEMVAKSTQKIINCVGNELHHFDDVLPDNPELRFYYTDNLLFNAVVGITGGLYCALEEEEREEYVLKFMEAVLIALQNDPRFKTNIT